MKAKQIPVSITVDDQATPELEKLAAQTDLLTAELITADDDPDSEPDLRGHIDCKSANTESDDI